MGRIYRNLQEIPIPTNARINHHDGQVSVYYSNDGQRRRTVIGLATSEYTMHANDNFKFLYPELWNMHYGESHAPSPQIHAGLYALTLGIGELSGLYGDLQTCFGPLSANAVLDFAMYSIRFRSNTAQLFEQEMADQMRFNQGLWSDSRYSKLFSEQLTDAAIHKFRTLWTERCAAQGVTDVWLCIDGSNNDCAAEDSEFAELGHAKSLRNTEIVNYIWAVNAKDGKPITWFVNPGGMPDCKAVKEVVQFLSASAIKVKGLILDRGFASQEVFDLARSCGIDHIVMLKCNSNGSAELMKKFAQKIRWSMEYIVDPAPIFGVVDSVKVFGQSPEKSCVGLFFSGMGGACRAQRLIQKIWASMQLLRQQIQEKPDKAKVPVSMKKYLSLVYESTQATGEEPKVKMPVDVEFNMTGCQEAIDGSGFYAIASGTDRTAAQIHDLYGLRDISEKQYSILKSQLNGDTTRSHTDQGIKSRLAVCFIASIIRTEIELACKALDLDTNVMIRKLDRAYFTYLPNGTYQAVYNFGKSLKELLGTFGIQEAHFGKFAEEFNNLSNPIQSLKRCIPSLEPVPANPGRGRRKGSKNKKTIEREMREKQLEAEAIAKGIELPAKRGPGRPKGSKNKKTIEREQREALAAQKAAAEGKPIEEPAKRKPGRPKGSKNKKTIEREKHEVLAAQKVAAEGSVVEIPVKRGPGRPKGSKNKKTLEREARIAAARARAERQRRRKTALTSGKKPPEGTPTPTTG